MMSANVFRYSASDSPCKVQSGYLGGGGPGRLGVAAGAGAGPHPGYHVMAAASSQRGGAQAGASWPSSAHSTESETKIQLLVYLSSFNQSDHNQDKREAIYQSEGAKSIFDFLIDGGQ